MIEKVTTRKQFREFVFFVEELYRNDPQFVCPIFSQVMRDLKKQIFMRKRYTALLSRRDGKVVGRILYNVHTSKKKKKDIGYFSFFDCIEDESVAKELLDAMEKDLAGKVDYIEGTYSPFDPDNRRGILVTGFDEPHSIFTSYNFPYYGKFLEKFGYSKAFDTFTMKIYGYERYLSGEAPNQPPLRDGIDIRVDSADLKHFDRDIEDIHEIFVAATTELNYQKAPDLEIIRGMAKKMKFFLNPKLVKIIRENGSDRPVGFCLVVPDFNEILQKTHGRIRPLAILLGKKKIKRARGILQYIIPEYQGDTVWSYSFAELMKSMKDEGFTYFEGGTIMEDNPKSWKVLEHQGANVSKIYRLYGKTISC